MLNLGTVYGGNNMSLSNLSSSMTSDQDGFKSGPLNVTRENLPAFNMSSEKNALLNLTSNGVTETEGTESLTNRTKINYYRSAVNPE